MKFIGKSLRILLLLSLLLTLFVSSLMAGDIIYLRNGEVKGKTGQDYKVVDVSYAKITYRIGKQRKDFFHTKEVRKIVFDTEGLPEAYTVGQDAYFHGEYQNAVNAFDQVERDSDSPWIVQYAAYYTAKSYQNGGKYNEAIQAYQDLRQKVADSIFYPATFIRMSECFGALKDFKSAQNVIADLAKEVEPKELGEYWRHKANYAKVKLTEMKGDFAQAFKDYMSLRTTVGPDFPQIQSLCHVAAANCLLQQRKYDEAIDLYKAAIKGTMDDEQEILAEAYSGLGECYFKKKDYKNTLLAYLRIVVINENHPLTVPAEFAAKALFYAGWCFELIRGTDSAKRAKENYRKCAQDYGLTQWGQEAAKKL